MVISLPGVEGTFVKRRRQAARSTFRGFSQGVRERVQELESFSFPLIDLKRACFKPS
jgi:hypothetical protein